MNFVRKDFAKNIIKYHKDLNRQGHDVIKNSALTLKHTEKIIEGNIKIDHSIQVGKLFWMIATLLPSTQGNIIHIQMGDSKPFHKVKYE